MVGRVSTVQVHRRDIGNLGNGCVFKEINCDGCIQRTNSNKGNHRNNRNSKKVKQSRYRPGVAQRVPGS
jgi:hypothetical protein